MLNVNLLSFYEKYRPPVLDLPILILCGKCQLGSRMHSSLVYYLFNLCRVQVSSCAASSDTDPKLNANLVKKSSRCPLPVQPVLGVGSLLPL